MSPVKLRRRSRRSGGRDRSERGGVERVLFKFFGPAQVSRYDPTPPEPVDATCPTCGRPISEHTIDRSTGRSFIRCP
jgi:hypothetical protein